jgi:hypothetical protein
MRLKESCDGRKHLSMQAEITIQRRKKERKKSAALLRKSKSLAPMSRRKQSRNAPAYR